MSARGSPNTLITQPMLINHQKRVALNLPSLRNYVRTLRRVLHMGRWEFNVCFVDDKEIKRLNTTHRAKAQPTDVLSFPWQALGKEFTIPPAVRGSARRETPLNDHRDDEFKNFLGDVVISAEMAGRNARVEGHSIHNEIRWLILHGLLHLLGHDHVRDGGEMTALEHSLRDRLGIQGSDVARRKLYLARA